jgi:hypothetical protein
MRKKAIHVAEPINSVLFVNVDIQLTKIIENNRLTPNNRVEKSDKIS